VREVVLLLIVSLLCVAPVIAQSPNATINGIILDPSGSAIAGAQVVVVNDATGVQYTTKTNGEGIYVVPNLPPGPYRIQVSNVGFKTIIKPDVILNVQDALVMNFTLPIGAKSEVVTVEGGAPLINTESAAVSTVVDRSFVANMPLNGRSFQDLILLTPGVVTNSPQDSSTRGSNGEFSVNGQRTESNYYTVDGVSANFLSGAGSVSPQATSGSLPASTALGTTQGLVSVDALEEFRVQSSTYSAEYGRNPGGQFSFVTRSGTNQWHGTAFEYLRNNVFDANDWFNDYFRSQKPPERQNDFGGTIGGPVEIPGAYNGKDRTFFFFSYEGLRLIQPQAASISYVPTLALRRSAAPAIQPILNAFPMPDCPPSATNCSNDLGDGLGQFVGTWSNPSSIDAYSIRLDHSINQKLKLFFRFSHTPSFLAFRPGNSAGGGLVDIDPSEQVLARTNLRTWTFGLASALHSRANNEFRLNYSTSDSEGSSAITSFGGGQSVDLAQLQRLSAGSYYDVGVNLLFGGFTQLVNVLQQHSKGLQRQWNATDALTVASGRHQFKVGGDYRRLAPVQHYSNPAVSYDYFSESSVDANSVGIASAQTFAPAYPHFLNFSAFAQDQWRVTSRWNLALGLRWDVNPAPGAPNGNLPYTIQGDINDPQTLKLAPQGTPLWRTSWYDIAPRLGMAYVLRNAAGYDTVVRGGVGVFFDTGQQLGTSGYNGAGFSGSAIFGSLVGVPASFPLSPSEASPAIVNPPVAPVPLVYAFAPHLQLPFTLQWNSSIQQALGKSQALTVTYVGANGRRLLEANDLSLTGSNATLQQIIYYRNGLTSDYDALQVQYQRRLVSRLQALASYTWSHSIDYGSQNTALPYVRGNSDYDVRHNFSAALTYELPGVSHGGFARAILHDWALDDRFMARTGFPVTLSGEGVVNPVTFQQYLTGLDLLAGQPLYIYGSQCAGIFGSTCPGGRAINPNAFRLPSGCTAISCPPSAVGDAPRNFVRGFGAWQMDLAVRREFALYERLKLQFRAEGFNVFNHPNFGAINATYCSTDHTSPAFSPNCTFGQATATLARSLGVLSPLYQSGGPRSMQFALKLIF